MEKRKQRKLETKGWRVGSAAEFLGLSSEEAALVEIGHEAAAGLVHGMRNVVTENRSLACYLAYA